MEKKKLRILFDAYVLGGSLLHESARSGIYFTALNILKELQKYPDIEIGIFSSEKKCANEITQLLYKEFPNNNFVPVYLDIITNLEKYKNKIASEYRQKKCFIKKLKMLFLSILIK